MRTISLDELKDEFVVEKVSPKRNKYESELELKILAINTNKLKEDKLKKKFVLQRTLLK
ncbi:hypothetical protein ACI6Q2_04570 [Chitinophagaceae bacterium LWZ2-11]